MDLRRHPTPSRLGPVAEIEVKAVDLAHRANLLFDQKQRPPRFVMRFNQVALFIPARSELRVGHLEKSVEIDVPADHLHVQLPRIHVVANQQRLNQPLETEILLVHPGILIT